MKIREAFEFENSTPVGLGEARAVCGDRWNEKSFQKKDMLVYVDIIRPTQRHEKHRTIYQQVLPTPREKTGSLSFAVGAIRPLILDTKSPRKELEYQWKEERTRIKE